MATSVKGPRGGDKTVKDKRGKFRPGLLSRIVEKGWDSRTINPNGRRIYVNPKDPTKRVTVGGRGRIKFRGQVPGAGREEGFKSQGASENWSKRATNAKPAKPKFEFTNTSADSPRKGERFNVVVKNGKRYHAYAGGQMIEDKHAGTATTPIKPTTPAATRAPGKPLGSKTVAWNAPPPATGGLSTGVVISKGALPAGAPADPKPPRLHLNKRISKLEKELAKARRKR